MGRPKTPLEKMEARSKGDGRTPGGREVTKPSAAVANRESGIPEPFVPLKGRGAVEWRKVWESGFWLKRDQDYHWVELLAKAYADIEIFQARIDEDGLVVTGYAGQVVAHPLIAEIRKCEHVIQKCLQVLGFSPTDRAKLGIMEAKARTAFEEFQSRVEERKRGVPD